jgi:hypothetical protein
MVKRIPFRIPGEPPLVVMRVRKRDDAAFTEALRRAMHAYFISFARPQTAMLPRNLIDRTIVEAIEHLCETAMVFPIFRLEHRKAKFVRCCYGQVWRSILGEWKGRLLFALGKKAGQYTLSRGFDPWLDLPI